MADTRQNDEPRAADRGVQRFGDHQRRSFVRIARHQQSWGVDVRQSVANVFG